MYFKLPYKHLARFAGNLATCQEAGLGMAQSLNSTRRSLSGTQLGHDLDTVVEEIERGATLSAAFAVAERRLPSFFIPMLEAGEQTGRLDEALRFIEHHCTLLAGPAQALRNLWLYPLAIVLAGSVIQLVAFMLLAPWRQTAQFFFNSLTSFAMFGVMVFVIRSPLFQPLVNLVTLWIPIFGATERELNANRFFHALAMLYAAAGHRVETMIRKAARTVANQVLQVDLLRVAHAVEGGASLPDAFEKSAYIPADQQQLIAAGDLSGTLERSFERIANDVAERLTARLAIVQQLSVRIMLTLVSLSLAGTAIRLIGQL